MAMKIFDHESCMKSVELKLPKCLISHNFNKGVVLDKVFFKGIGVIDVDKGTLATNNGTTI